MRSVFMLALLVGVTACGGSRQPAPPGTPPQVTLEAVTVAATASAGERLFDGAVEAVEQATLTAQTSGRVVALERDVDASVDRGALIMRLSGVEQRARLDAARQGLAEAEARAVEAAAGFERTRSVYERRLVPRAELDRATAEHEAAQARLAAARAAVSAAGEESSYTEIRAPFAGVVTRRFVDVGEAVSPGQPLAASAAPGRRPWRRRSGPWAQRPCTCRTAQSRRVTSRFFPRRLRSRTPSASASTCRQALPDSIPG
jgi:multidrug efflux pump subunit AcrA (membrane-fusion protein)